MNNVDLELTSGVIVDLTPDERGNVLAMAVFIKGPRIALAMNAN